MVKSVFRLRLIGLVTAAAGIVASPVATAPAAAGACGTLAPCISDVVPLPDVTGDVYGVTCGGVFTSDGVEGTRDYWSGPVQGATYLHESPDTRSMRITCSVRDSSSPSGGTLRGSVSRSSIAPLTFMVSAAGADLVFWSTHGSSTERLFMCTQIAWTDKFGIAHSRYYDDNPSAAGVQCPEFLSLPI